MSLMDIILANILLSPHLLFLTSRPQTMRMNNTSSSCVTLHTSSPQDCVLSPLLYILLTYACTVHYASNLIVKFADDTAVVGLIKNNNETAERQEVDELVKWCKRNNLVLNINKTKNMLVDFRRTGPTAFPSSLMVLLWRWSPALNILGSTLQTTSPGRKTHHTSSKRLTSASTF